ncbi:MAG: indole-3-glycerol phosphate synthase TrpC [Verrucomicrobia bacterium]|nr:MAG: indole-3-glycerol phosphate synthase TrpC [Verrucomicrobiota bacterium]
MPALPTILDRIVATKRQEIARLPAREVSPEDVRQARAASGVPRDFLGALRQPVAGDVALIAEVKKASPSAGVIREDFDPVAIARTYEAAGASCLSVLTDEPFFQGSLDYLRRIRGAVGRPLLRKDFILDPRQVLEAAEAGADAVLLIVAILDDEALRGLHQLATDAGLAALVEVHDEAELDRALAVGAGLIGVNNRNLRDFTVDLATTEHLARRIAQLAPGDDILLVAESGIHSRADVERLRDAGARGILVGESLMREPDPAVKVAELLGL